MTTWEPRTWPDGTTDFMPLGDTQVRDREAQKLLDAADGPEAVRRAIWSRQRNASDGP